MSDENWYRNKDWNPSIEDEFLERLARARSQRDQYLAIQALTIAELQPEVALQLVDRYLSTKTTTFDDIRALSARAYALRKLGRLFEAAQVMKEILAIERHKPGNKTRMFADFPYFVASNRMRDEYAAAIGALDERVNDMMFPVDTFLCHAARAMIFSELGKQEDAVRSASVALDSAKIKKSRFRFHQNLGLVGREHTETVASLLKIIA
ncbi:hypothetical protein SAMN04515617_1183 [Collimonas sp. OK242]|uniref:hypothetical protein n=1 Tax=Collimonas sp. OK242 TaxID=1798195 RepID=UPI00089950D8|nr:hypothetical protein [Collimonas sp. OK242]SDY63261.1 hypothetical protein SAMN04515617_1183 [Collimonas sp. OK242]